MKLALQKEDNLLRFFSNFLCCICKSFYLNHLFMCDFPFLLCFQHTSNRLILFQGGIYKISCLPVQSNRHSSPSLRRSIKLSACPDFYQWFFLGRKVLLIGFLTLPRRYSADNIIFSRFVQSWKSVIWILAQKAMNSHRWHPGQSILYWK